MNDEKKIYAPVSAKMNTFASGHSILKLGINVEKFKAFLDQFKNERGYVNLGISQRRKESDFGETHTVWLDTWKPDVSKIFTPDPAIPSAKPAPAVTDYDDVPF